MARNVRQAVSVKPGARPGRSARAALIDAFNHLFLNRRTRDPRVSEVVAHAGVARSTFYDHYGGIDELHMAALSRPFAVLADALAGPGDSAALEQLLRHFWENRDRARSTLGGESRARVERLLAGMILDRMPESASATIPMRLAALQLAGAELSLIRAWLVGEAHCEPPVLARNVLATAASLRASLFNPSS